MHEEELLALLRSADLHPIRLLRFGNQPGPCQTDAGYSLVIEAVTSETGGNDDL
jgi:hypothetical protein